MKLIFSVITFFCFFLLQVQAVQAEGDGFYLEVNASTVDLDFHGAGIEPGPSGEVDLVFDRFTSLGIATGYTVGRWAVELEYLQSNGEYDVALDNSSGRTQERFDYEDFRVSGVFRTSGQWYFLGKLGMSFPDLDVRSRAIRLDMGDALFYGIGTGLRFNDKLSVELEVTDTQDDTTAVSLGLGFHF